MTDQVAKKSLKNKTLLIVLILFSIIGLFLMARFLIPQVLVYLTRATRSTEYSLSNSYIFGSPLVVSADGETKVRINAFLLSSQGIGVADKLISLETKPKEAGGKGKLQVEEVQAITDKFGKAVFEVVSNYQGQFVVSALIDGFEFPQTVTLTFK